MTGPVDAGQARVRVVPDLSRFLSEAKAQVQRMHLEAPVRLTVDTSGFRAQVESSLRTMRPTVDVGVRVDWSGFQTQLRNGTAGQRNGITIPVDVDTRVGAEEMAAFRAAVGRPITIDVDLNTNGAAAEMAALLAAFPNSHTIDINTNGGAGGAGGLLRGLSGIASMAGTAKIATIALGAVTLIPLIASAREALGVIALLPGAVTAAAATIATIVVGTTGVSDAIEAGGEAAKASGQAQEDSAKAVAAAQRGVRDAYENAASTAEQGADSLVAAEESVQDAQKASKDAQDDLTQSRKDALEQIQDLNLELRGSALDERGAILSLQRAQQRLRELGKNGQPVTQLDVSEAVLGVDQAKQRIDEVRERNTDLRNETVEANARGVEGSEQVLAAKENIAAADKNLTLAQRDQIRTVRDVVIANRNAQEAITDAIANVAEAGKIAAAEADKYAEALANLSPNAQQFVKDLRGIADEWKATRMVVQDALFDQLGASVVTFAENQLPVLETGLSNIATVINENVRGALDYMSTADFGFSMEAVFEDTSLALGYLLDGLGYLGQAFEDIAVVGAGFLPGLTGGTDGDGGFLGWAKDFAQTVSDMRASGELEKWIQGAIDKFEQLWNIGKSVIEVVDNILDGSEETGDGMLVSIQQTLDKWNEFLGSTEGQDRIKQFFEEVKTTCSAIADIISGAASIVGFFMPDPLSESGDGGSPTSGDGAGTVATTSANRAAGSSVNAGSDRPSTGDKINRYLALGSGRAQPEGAGSPLLGGVNEEGEYERDVFGRAWDQFGGFFGEVGDVGDWIGGGAYDGLGARAGQSPASALWDKMFGRDDEPASAVGSGQGGRGARDYDALADQLEAPSEEDTGAWGAFKDTLAEVGTGAVDLGTKFTVSVAGTATDAWNGLKDGVVSGWNEHIAPAWQMLREEGLVGVANGFLDNITGGAVTSWGELPSAIGDGVSDIIDTHFPGLKTGFEGVKTFFAEVGQGIKGIWSDVTSFLSEKIDWVISKVINGGIGRAYSAVDGFLLGKLPDWTDVPLIGMEAGGEVPLEPGTTRGKDGVVRLLAPGEVVMSLPAVEAAGVDNLLAFNASAQKGQRPSGEGLFRIGMEQGGLVSKENPAWDSIKKGHDFAKSQDGKPYQWAGPRFVNDSFDCTGFMSSIASAILDQNVWTRKFFTGSFNGGETGPMGFKRGLGAGFSIGIHDDPGGAGGGHAAGTLSGVEGLPDINVEAGGNQGDVQYGDQAAGASHSQFPWKYHLPIVDGAFVDPGPGGGASGPDKKGYLASKAEDLIDAVLSPIRDMVTDQGTPPPQFMAALPALFEQVTAPFKDFVTSKIDGLGDLVSGIYDSVKDKFGAAMDFAKSLNPFNRDTGGSLPPGLNLVNNGTGKNEYVVNPEHWDILASFLGLLKQGVPLSQAVPGASGDPEGDKILTDGLATYGDGVDRSLGYGPDYTDPTAEMPDRFKTMGTDFLTANSDQFLSDLGWNKGGGAIGGIVSTFKTLPEAIAAAQPVPYEQTAQGMAALATLGPQAADPSGTGAQAQAAAAAANTPLGRADSFDPNVGQGPQIHLHVQSVDEAMRRAQVFLNQQTLSFTRR